MITFLSRNGLRERHSYGYYLFFTFEFALLLMVTNLRLWFADPLSLLQIFSWILLLVSLYLFVAGMELRQKRMSIEREGPAQLIETGLYGKIRHPMYSALLFLSFAAYLKGPSLFSSLLEFGFLFTLVTAVRAEESVDEKKFGSRYLEYKQKTKMFIPYII